ncbi:MAG: hypothetical protein FJ265_09875 [Planctomycetes bacterium]|nr:hypothetical protein [Planctomycetota bacterium]
MVALGLPFTASRWLALFALAACAAAPALPPAPAAAPAPRGEAWLRVNLVGYLPGDPKVAVLSADEPWRGTFAVGDFTGTIGPDLGPWGPFAHNHRLDFSALVTPGTYTITIGSLRSPPFCIGDDAYAAVIPALREFLRLQRCGDNPITGERCHQQDGIDVSSGERVDLVGGWHDAGDRLKHMITTTYCTAALQLAGEREEAEHGARLVAKLHPDPDTIYVQIGDDRDHLPPLTLWHLDRSDYGHGPGGARSAWPATGAPQGPKHKNASTGVANLAGRTAAALALCGRVDLARSALELALRKPGVAMSVPVRAPYYYGESSWHDDVEWGAIELFVVTGERRYLELAIEHARAAGASEWMGADGHGHYEFFPYVNLAHCRLHAHAPADVQGELAGFYRQGLERVRQRAAQNPYDLGTALVWCSTNDAIAVATQALLYERMSGDPRYRVLGTAARDWLFGRNPWGVSFVCGVPAGGDAASQPHHPFWKLLGRLPKGGLVDGPVTRAINASLKFADFGEDRLARFQSDVAVYHDVFADFSTNEPILDGTVSLLYLLSLQGPAAGR